MTPAPKAQPVPVEEPREPSSETSSGAASAPAAARPAAKSQTASVSEPSEPSDAVEDSSPSKPVDGRPRAPKQAQRNNVRKLRQDLLMSKAELARRAGVSPLTIDRVEEGFPCRMDTKRKILEALGLSPSARASVWPDIDQG